MNMLSFGQGQAFTISDLIRLASRVREVCASPQKRSLHRGEPETVAEKVEWTRISTAARVYDPDWINFTDDAVCLSDEFVRMANRFRSKADRNTAMVHALTKRYLATLLAAARMEDFEDALVPARHYARAIGRHDELFEHLNAVGLRRRSYSTLALQASQHSATGNSYLLSLHILHGEGNDTGPTTGYISNEIKRVGFPFTSNVRCGLVLLGNDAEPGLEDVELCDNIHLVGNPKTITCVIFVSGLNEIDPTTGEGDNDHFTIDSAALRDVFLGRSNRVVEQATNEILRRSPDIVEPLERPAMSRPFPFRPEMGKHLSFLSEAGLATTRHEDSAEREVDTGETLISSSRVARKFFGYKGLPEP